MTTPESIYRQLYLIRRVEEKIAEVYPTDKVKSPIHLSIGQEAISVAVGRALESEDIVFSTCRGHAAYLAKGGDLKAMIAELYGKAAGCAKGKGGSMHLVDVAAGVMPQSAIVASTIPESVGYALALKLRGEKRVVVSFFGDGATDEGVFHESLNFAALMELPIIFVCENNLYSIHCHVRDRMPHDNILDRARSYGLSAERLEANDVLALAERLAEIVSQVKGGQAGPRLVECLTYRWREHVGPDEDYECGYRDRAESAPWVEADPLKKLAARLDSTRRAELEAEAEAEMAAAFEFAEAAPFPAETELLTDLFAE